MHSATKSQQKDQMRRYALWFLLGGVMLTIVLVGLTYKHLLSTPEVQIQKASVQMTQKPPVGGATGGDEGSPKKQKAKTTLTWKMKNVDVVPPELVTVAAKIMVTESTVQFNVENKEQKIAYREVNPASGKKFDVLFLHGMRFESKTWQDIGTLQLVGAMGYRAIAVDLPGYGGSASSPKPLSPGLFLEKLIRELKLDKPVLITPSMSGSTALPFLFKPTAETCSDRVRGFIPIAPAGTTRFEAADYTQCKVPTMIVYGENDKSAPVSTLGQLPNSDTFVIKNAGHVCYKDEPKEWHRLLYGFLLALGDK